MPKYESAYFLNNSFRNFCCKLLIFRNIAFSNLQHFRCIFVAGFSLLKLFFLSLYYKILFWLSMWIFWMAAFLLCKWLVLLSKNMQMPMNVLVCECINWGPALHRTHSINENIIFFYFINYYNWIKCSIIICKKGFSWIV